MESINIYLTITKTLTAFFFKKKPLQDPQNSTRFFTTLHKMKPCLKCGPHVCGKFRPQKNLQSVNRTPRSAGPNNFKGGHFKGSLPHPCKNNRQGQGVSDLTKQSRVRHSFPRTEPKSSIAYPEACAKRDTPVYFFYRDRQKHRMDAALCTSGTQEKPLGDFQTTFLF